MQNIWPDLNFMFWDREMDIPSKEMSDPSFSMPQLCGKEEDEME